MALVSESLPRAGFGELTLGVNGRDPFLEDERTLWMLHWRACTSVPHPLFAWHWLVNLCHEPGFTHSEAFRAFAEESDTYPRPLSPTTLRQHLNVFLGTYVPAQSTQGQVPEDLLDSPLSVLGFIRRVGDRRGEHGRDPYYVIDVRSKPTIPNGLFRFVVHDWWNRFMGKEQTVLFSDVAFGSYSPGRVFRMPEAEVRDRLVRLAQERPAEFQVMEGANQRLLHRRRQARALNRLLAGAYQRVA